MSITKKLTKHGNSYALVIERPILKLLGINANTLLQISTPDGATIVITPLQNGEPKKDFSSALEATNKKYGKALKKLAE